MQALPAATVTPSTATPGVLAGATTTPVAGTGTLTPSTLNPALGAATTNPVAGTGTITPSTLNTALGTAANPAAGTGTLTPSTLNPAALGAATTNPVAGTGTATPSTFNTALGTTANPAAGTGTVAPSALNTLRGTTTTPVAGTGTTTPSTLNSVGGATTVPAAGTGTTAPSTANSGIRPGSASPGGNIFATAAPGTSGPGASSASPNPATTAAPGTSASGSSPTLVAGSAQILRFVDSGCAAGVAALNCLTGYASYNVSVVGANVDRERFYLEMVNKTQQSIQGGALQNALRATDGSGILVVDGSSDPAYFVDAAPETLSPVTANPNATPQTEEDEGKKIMGMSVGPAVAVILSIILGGIALIGAIGYAVYTFVLGGGDTSNAKKDGPTKDGSDYDDDGDDRLAHLNSDDDLGPAMGGLGNALFPDPHDSDEEKPAAGKSPGKAEFGFEIGGPGEFNVGLEDDEEESDDESSEEEEKPAGKFEETGFDSTGFNAEKKGGDFFTTSATSNTFFAGDTGGWGQAAAKDTDEEFGFENDDETEEEESEAEEEEDEEEEEQSYFDDEAASESENSERERYRQEIEELVAEAAPHELENIGK